MTKDTSTMCRDLARLATVLFALCAVEIGGVRVQAQKQPETFTFLNITDSHGPIAGNLDPLTHFVTSMVDSTSRPAFIVETGDVTETGKTDEYAQFKAAIAPLHASGVGFYAVPGNHDVKWNPGAKEEFARAFGKLYQSFDFGGDHFILLDSTVALEHWGHFDKAELDWLDRDLKKLRPDTPIFIFLHHSIGRDGPTNRLIDNEFDLIRRFAGHNVIAVFTGHGHDDLAWKTNGVQTVMSRGLTHGSYYRVSVTPVLVTVDRVDSEGSGTPFHVSIPILRRSKPSQLRAGWDDPNVPFLERKRPAVTLEPRAVADNPDNEKADYRIEDGPWKAMTKDARDIWRDVFATKPISVGVHSATVRLTTSAGVALSDELIFEVERTNVEPTQRWAINLEGPIQSSPQLVEDTLYVSSVDGKVYALSSDKGKRRWLFATKGPILGSPLVQDGTLFVGSTDHYVYAIDAKTGKQHWKFDTGSAVVATPALADGVVCIGGNRTIFGIDAARGTLRWSRPTEGFFQSRAATDGSTIYLGGWDNTVYALDAATGEPRWTRKLGKTLYYSPAIASPCFSDGRIYICTNDNTLHALDARSGDVRWSINAPKGGDPLGYSSPIVAGGTVCLAGLGEHGDVYAFSAAGGSLVWKSSTGQAIYDSSLRMGPDGKSMAILGMRGQVTVLSTSDGHRLWGYELGPGNIFSTPEYDGGAVYTVTMADDVQAIAAPESGRSPLRRASSDR